jgi:hypothetical protein
MEVDGKVDAQGRCELSANAALTYENGVLVAMNHVPFDALLAIEAVRKDRLSAFHEKEKE